MDKRVCPLLSPCIAVRRDRFEVATTVNLTADVVLEGVHHLGALRVPEHHARRMVFDVVEVHFLTDLAVVALFGFFEELQISFETFLVGKAGAVHAGQLVAVLVAMPVSTRHGEHLEILELASRRHVGAGTEVFKVLARFASHVEAERTVAAFASESALSVPHTIVWVGLYCKATRAHLRHARAALATKPRSASLVPKGSLSLTQNIFMLKLILLKKLYFQRK